MYENNKLLNVVAMLFSTAAKKVNRNATAYALQLTLTARDGGMREDSVKVLGSSLCSPRTAQRYDIDVLSKDWNFNSKQALLQEALHFSELHEMEQILEKIDPSSEDYDNIAEKVKMLKQTIPYQIEIVWDNINFRRKHRFERKDDCYEDYNVDWVASLLVQERISANHMDHKCGLSLKTQRELNIEDYVPTDYEKSYLLDSLVHYYSYRLVHRHPKVFKSIKPKVKVIKRISP